VFGDEARELNIANGVSKCTKSGHDNHRADDK